jgi:hypothetical protein
MKIPETRPPRMNPRLERLETHEASLSFSTMVLASTNKLNWKNRVRIPTECKPF